MRAPIRIAILEADTPLQKTKSKYGGYGGAFELLLRAGAKALGQPDPDSGLIITKHDVVSDLESYPDLDKIDAILITGSRHDAFADTPWTNKLVDFTRKVLAQNRIRVIGVCFGHQIVGRALGAKVGRNSLNEWEAAVHEVQLTEKGKQIFGRDVLKIHQMHRDIVFHAPDTVENLGTSPVCAVQGMYQAHKLITVQGHPEFTEDIVREILDTRHQTGVFDEVSYQKHIKKVALPHDGLVVSQAFLRFLLD